MKGLSDGNVLLRTGHGAGAGMSSAPQPAKWLCPVLVAPALNTCTQTHLCVCTCIPLTRPVFSAQESPLTQPHVFCLPWKDWNRKGCPTFARSRHKTHSTKSRGAEWLSLAETESLHQESPAGLLPRPCTLLQLLPSGF